MILGFFLWPAKCRLCGRRERGGRGRVLIYARQDRDMSTVLMGPEEDVALELLDRLGLELHRLKDIRRDVFLCDRCMETQFRPVAKTYLKEVSLKNDLRGGAVLGPHNNRNVSLIGGVGQLGVMEALKLLVEMYEITQEKNTDPGGIPYWVQGLSVQLIRDGVLAPEELTPAMHQVLIECLRIESTTLPSSYSSFIDDISTLADAGVQMPTDIWDTIGEWSDEATHLLEPGVSEEYWGGWGATLEVATSHARDVVAKARSIKGASDAGEPPC